MNFDILYTILQYVYNAVVGLFMCMFVFFFDPTMKGLDILVALMFMDYVTGVCAAWIVNDSGISSRRSVTGLIKKFMMACIVCTCHLFDVFLGINILQQCAIFTLIGNEGISIVENASRAGVPIPKALVTHLEQIKSLGGKK